MTTDPRALIAAADTALGIEFGSTRIKAVLIGPDHEVLATGGHAWENHLEDGLWSYTLDEVVVGLRSAYASLVADVRERYDVTPTSYGSIGISGMMHGYLAFDADDNLLAPFRTWRNTNTGRAADELTHLFGFNIPLRWSIAHLHQAVLDSEEHAPRVARLTTLAGWVHHQLTGRHVLGIGDASGMFPVDSTTGTYVASYLDQYEALVENRVPWRLRDVLPTVLSAGEDAGALTPEGAALIDPTGALQPGIVLCPPEGDAGTGMIATNAIAQRTGNISCGTSVFLMAVIERSLTELHTDKSNSLVDLVSESSKMVVAPMPNLYFTRDPFAMIGNGVSINRMYSETRNRETIYGEYIFTHHPLLKGTPEYYSRYNTFHIEGGDILNINDKVLAIGISQRTEPDAIDAIAKNIFNDPTSPIETILAFNIPNSRAFMHLDTVFTQIDTDKFTIHPGIMGPLTVFEITAAGEGIKVKEVNGTLESILETYVGHPVELIPCGGGDRIAAEREQWNDGSNTLCIAPGKIVVYERNDVTNKVLRDKGLDLIIVPSAELSRGRGGPRCMSMPIERED